MEEKHKYGTENNIGEKKPTAFSYNKNKNKPKNKYNDKRNINTGKAKDEKYVNVSNNSVNDQNVQKRTENNTNKNSTLKVPDDSKGKQNKQSRYGRNNYKKSSNVKAYDKEGSKQNAQNHTGDKNYKKGLSVKNADVYTGKQNKKPNQNNSQGGQRRPVKKDSFDDIKSYGGRYIQTNDYKDWDDSDSIDSYDAENVVTEEESEVNETSAVAGRNAVRELLRSDRSVDKLFVKSGSREGSLVVIVTDAISRGIPVIEASQEKLDQLSMGTNHQGVVAMAAEKQYTDVDGILAIARERGETPLVVIADGIEDPRNLGALIRCAECAGAHGIIIPKRRSSGLTSVVAKASAGAIEHMAIAKVSNIAHTIETLKKKGLWIFASEAGATPYYEADFNVPAAIIFGSEGSGIGRSLKEKSDILISIPMYGKVNSLNVSTAASVILCHAARIQHEK